MQKSGTEVIKTKIQPSKPKREIANTTHSQNTKRTYGQPSEQISRKVATQQANRTKHNINIHKVKRPRNSDTKKQAKENHNKTITGTKHLVRYSVRMITL